MRPNLAVYVLFVATLDADQHSHCKVVFIGPILNREATLALSDKTPDSRHRSCRVDIDRQRAGIGFLVERFTVRDVSVAQIGTRSARRRMAITCSPTQMMKRRETSEKGGHVST